MNTEPSSVEQHRERMERRLLIEPPSSGSIMVIAAHPDDIESWCAGTLAGAIDSGASIRLMLVTSGDKGSGDPAADAAFVAAQREAEAQEAARRLGLEEVIFLRQPDGDVEDTRALRGEFVSWIRRWRPAVLFTHDPEHPYPPYLAHRDHRIVGRLALDAVYPCARDSLSFPEQVQAGLAPHAVAEIWLFASELATVYVNIATGFERKLAARLAHQSQTPDPTALAESWRTRAAQIGEAVDVRGLHRTASRLTARTPSATERTALRSGSGGRHIQGSRDCGELVSLPSPLRTD